MSIELMTRVWKFSSHRGTSLLLLLSLADYANDEGICWPSITTLAHKCRLSPRQTQRLIQKLVGSKEIKVLHIGDGRGNSSRYRVTPPSSFGAKGCHMGQERVTSRAERVTSTTEKGDTAMSPESFKESFKEPSFNQDDQFSIFWDRIRYAIKLTYSSMPSATKQKLDATKLLSLDDGRATVLCLMGDEQCAWLTDRMSKPIERELKLISDSEINEVQFVTGSGQYSAVGLIDFKKGEDEEKQE